MTPGVPRTQALTCEGGVAFFRRQRVYIGPLLDQQTYSLHMSCHCCEIQGGPAVLLVFHRQPGRVVKQCRVAL